MCNCLFAIILNKGLKNETIEVCDMKFLLIEEFNSRSHVKICEIFERTGYGSNFFLERGEILTRFLRVNPSDFNSILQFLYFCGFVKPSQRPLPKKQKKLMQKFYIQQEEVKEFIKKYTQISQVYTYNNKYIIETTKDEKEKEAKQRERILSPTMHSIANALNNQLKNVKYALRGSANKFPDSINREWRKEQSEKLHFLHNYSISLEYSFNSPFEAVWVELASLIQKEGKYLIFKTCSSCNTLFIRNINRKLCCLCKIPPSRDNSKEITKLKNRIRQQRNRKPLTKEYINKLMCEYKDNDNIIVYLQNLRSDLK